MKILCLAHRIPFPPNKGDKIRSFNILKYLAGKHEVFLGTLLENESDRAYLANLERYCTKIHAVPVTRRRKLIKALVRRKPFSVTYFHDRSLQNFVDTVLQQERPGAVVCICSSMAEYVFRTPSLRAGKRAGLKLIMDYIDFDSHKWRRYAEHFTTPLRYLYGVENKRLQAYELKINQHFDHSLFVSQQELKLLQAAANGSAGPASVMANGVDMAYFRPKGTLKEKGPPVLLFTGVMDYFANVDGVQWFSESILPQIRARFPAVQFYIVGMRPVRAIRRLQQIDGIHVTGFVDDIRPYYERADVCVAPLRIARGVQNKILEAMATANAVVATGGASAGIACRPNIDLMVADEPAAFAACVVALLQDKASRRRLGTNALQTIQRHYAWESNLRKLDALLQ